MLWTGLTLILLGVTGAAAEHPPALRVTTDSSAYCTELATRLAAQPNAAEEPVVSLGREGRELCATGHVRTGIAKLRRALRAAQGGG
jgi:hypothetical protein